MQTHMNNTRAQLTNDVVSRQQFVNHIHTLHKDIKAAVVTRRPSQPKIVTNNKVILNKDPNEHMHRLFKKLYSTTYKSKIDNKQTFKPIRPYSSTKAKKLAHIQQQRENISLQNRIANCKGINQRKKDNTDPIINPPYLIRPPEQISNAIIDKYAKKVLSKNRPKSGVPQSKKHLLQTQEQKKQIKGGFGQLLQTRKRPITAQQRKQFADLPPCTFKAILNHIVQHTMFKDSDLKVFYFRLCHSYGEQMVDKVWEQIMDELQK